MNVLVLGAVLEDAMLNSRSSLDRQGRGTKCPSTAGTASCPDALSVGAVQVVGAVRLHRQGCEGTVPSQQLCLGYEAN